MFSQCRFGATAGLENALCRGWIVFKLGCRTSGPGHQFAPAIGADAHQHRLGAGNAESTFKRADAGLARFRWKVTVAAFTVWSKFKHGCILDSKRHINIRTDREQN